MSDVVLVSTIGEGERRVGRLTLNTPRILNSLDAEMIEIMLAKLLEWAEDDSIAAVYIDGEGEKAFCAGADLSGGTSTFGRERKTNAFVSDYMLS